MESSTRRTVVTAALAAGLVGVLLGWLAASAGGRDADTEVVQGKGYVHPHGTHLYIDTDGDGGSDREGAGLAAAEWWDGETWWHGPDDDGREQDCLPDGTQEGDDLRPVEAGFVDVPPFGGGNGGLYVVWFRCPGTF